MLRLRAAASRLAARSRDLQAAGLQRSPCAGPCARAPQASCLAQGAPAARAFASEVYSKDTRPREWAIWKKIDRDRDGEVTMAEVRMMCRRFDATAHADVLVSLLDPTGCGTVSFEHFCKNFKAVSMVRSTARLKHWNRTFGLGVAGNVAGHMAQAGEADPNAAHHTAATPAAVFTFYAPMAHTVDATEAEVLSQLASFPVTNAVIDFPRMAGAGNVQVEPELGLYCDIVYARDGNSVERLVPRRVAAFNDCSLRKLDGSEKLSEKKNWGAGSKGISLRSLRVNSISKGTIVDKLVLTSYIKRGDQIYKYSVDAPARTYLMFHDELLDWIVHSINTQTNTGKWEEIFPQLVKSDYPTSMWIALGAGEYTDWGASNFLQPADETLVLVYNEDDHPHGPDMKVVADLFDYGNPPKSLISLHQTFV